MIVSFFSVMKVVGVESILMFFFRVGFENYKISCYFYWFLLVVVVNCEMVVLCNWVSENFSVSRVGDFEVLYCREKLLVVDNCLRRRVGEVKMRLRWEWKIVSC